MGVERKRKKTHKFFGIPFFSTEETFSLNSYPKNIQTSLRESNIPSRFYPVALAVVGKAFFETKKLWGDKMADTDLTWRVPMLNNFDQDVLGFKQVVAVSNLNILSENLFGLTNTPPDLTRMMEEEIHKILTNIGG